MMLMTFIAGVVVGAVLVRLRFNKQIQLGTWYTKRDKQ